MSSSEAPADGGGGGGEPAQSRWKAVRPWLPPCQSGSSASSSGAPSCSQPQPGADTASAAADDDCSTLSLRVIDVSSTAVALVISSPSLSHGESHRAAPLISVQLDRQPWPHVAHTSSVQPASGSDDAPRASSASWTDADRSEMAVVVYGLHPGHEYSISLDVVHGNLDDAHVLNSADIATPDELSLHISSSSSHHAAAAALASPDRDPARSASLDISAHDDDGSLPAPPPYSPAAPPPPPTETQLRATLKEIRANAKRTEGVLNASISALKKSVEKGMKEDQRSRTRMHGLEDAIRKAKDGARRMRTIDADDCDARIQELLEAEEELNDELGRRKEGSKRHSRDETSMPSPADATTPSDRAAPRPPQSTSATATTAADDDDDAPKTPATAQFNTGPSLAELSRELDGLARMLDDTEKAQRKQAKDWLRSLESELGSLEGELIQLGKDEEEIYTRQMDPAARSRWSRQQRQGDGRNFFWRFRKGNGPAGAAVEGVGPTNATSLHALSRSQSNPSSTSYASSFPYTDGGGEDGGSPAFVPPGFGSFETAEGLTADGGDVQLDPSRSSPSSSGPWSRLGNVWTKK